MALNDESVLENHHLAVAFQLLQHQDCDTLEDLTKKKRETVRRTIIEIARSPNYEKVSLELASGTTHATGAH